MKKITGTLALMLFLTAFVTGCRKIEDDPVMTSGEQIGAVSDEGGSTINNGTDINDDPIVTITELSETVQKTEELILTTAPQYDPTDTAAQIIQTAEALIGIPFSMNGTSPETGFDNPGFIYYVLRENGFINCPRLIVDQASMGTHTDYGSLKRGDLVFFSTDNSGKADFGGIYIGEGQMIYCPYPEQTVQIVSISSDYWVNAFYVGVRLS